MNTFLVVLGCMWWLAMSTQGWSSAATDVPHSSPPPSSKIYKEPLGDAEACIQAVDSIAKGRISYNQQLIDYLRDRKGSEAEKRAFILEKTKVKLFTAEALISSCEEDINRWDLIVNAPPFLMHYHCVRFLSAELEGARMRSIQGGHPLDRDFNEGYFFSECLSLLSSICNFPFSMREDVQNGLLSPRYFHNATRWALGNELLENASRSALKIWSAEDPSMKTVSVLVGLLAKHKERLATFAEEYARLSQSIREMSPRKYDKWESDPSADDHLLKIQEPVIHYARTLMHIEKIRDSLKSTLVELIESGIIEKAVEKSFQDLFEEFLEKEIILVLPKIDLTSTAPSSKLPLEGLATEPQFPPAGSEEVGSPITKEDWAILQTVFSMQKNGKRDTPVPPLQTSRFTASETEAIKYNIKMFVEAPAYKYQAVSKNLFNLLKMDAPMVHGHNNMCVRIPNKEGDRFTIRFYDNPHGPNEGKNAFWRKALSDGFKEAGWLD